MMDLVSTAIFTKDLTKYMDVLEFSGAYGLVSMHSIIAKTQCESSFNGGRSLKMWT